jgi:hypothetical protein
MKGQRSPDGEQRLWQDTVTRIGTELSRLPSSERGWLERHLVEIGDAQQRLHQLFLLAGGSDLCAACDGACCDCGRNHLTLANLLAILVDGGEPPTPDFTAACPLLGAQGCRLPAAQRPFNCVIFLCDTLEARLSPLELRQFHAVEQTLRRLYRELERRYAGAGLSGLLIRAEGLGDRAFFDRP